MKFFQVLLLCLTVIRIFKELQRAGRSEAKGWKWFGVVGAALVFPLLYFGVLLGAGAFSIIVGAK